MGLMDWARNFWKSKTADGVVENVFGVVPAASRVMRENTKLWWAMYINHPPWESCDVRPLGLPSAIGRELARHAMAEFEIHVSGSPRAVFLDRQMQEAAKGFLNCLELGLCLGGVALKPYPVNGELRVDVSPFTPTRFDGTGKAVGGVFVSQPVRQGKQWFVRMEYHDFLHTESGGQVYVIRNRAFYSSPDGGIGAQTTLDCVPEWADLSPDTFISGLEGPLFAYFQPPAANDIDPGSKMGVSVYAGAAAELIRQADEQWRLIRWEYESGKRRIYVDGVDAGQFHDEIFAVGPFSRSGEFFSVFSPAFRDDPLYHGLQRILQRIEFCTGLAYGTISDPQIVEKTATEIVAAKHRQYVTENSIQKAFQRTVGDLMQAMDAWCDLLGLAPAGISQVKYAWGDGVLDDPEIRRLDKALDAELVEKGILNNWEFRMKWYGEDEKTAKAAVNLPGIQAAPVSEYFS